MRRKGRREGGRERHVPSSAAEVESVGHKGEDSEDQEGSSLKEREGGREGGSEGCECGDR